MDDLINIVAEELNALQLQLKKGNSDINQLITNFKETYSFQSSNEALIQLLLDDPVDFPMIAKLMLQECAKKEFPSPILHIVDQIHFLK